MIAIVDTHMTEIVTKAVFKEGAGAGIKWFSGAEVSRPKLVVRKSPI